MIEAQAVKIDGKGGTDVLSIGQLMVADPGPGQLLVEVVAAGLNRADILQRKGFYPAPPGVPADVPGLEFAGKVAAVGDGVGDFSVGDPVMGIAAGGGMSTHLVAHSREVLRVPEGMSLTDAAAIPEVFLTAFDALNVQAGMGMGHDVLVHAIGSGIGTAALQLCLATGARPLGTSRTQDKLDRCADLGLTDGVLVTDNTFAQAVGKATRGRGVQKILDSIGGAYLAENLKSLAVGGHMVVIGLLGGAAAELPLGLLLAKRASLTGTVLRSRSLEEKATLGQRFQKEVVPMFDAGKLKPVVDQVMPMADIGEAHKRMEANDVFGKIVMAW